MGIEQNIRLYHTTDRAGLEGARKTETLLGMERLHRSPGYSGGSNLTPEKIAALAFIKAYRAEGRWRDIDGPPDLFLLTFYIPGSLVKPVRTTPIFGCEEWATTMTVDARVLPSRYLNSLHAGMCRMTREEAIKQESWGEVRFYEVPFIFLECVEPVEYTFRGVTYPLYPSL